MSDTVTGAVHTAGPWALFWDDIPHSDIGEGWTINAPTGSVAICDGPNDINEANARLIVAACNSYDRHFGPHAVSAAEGDLLGKALEALRAWEKLHDGMIAEGGDVSALPADRLVHFAKVQAVALNETRAILSQAQAREVTR